jgi:hypothetical protein
MGGSQGNLPAAIGASVVAALVAAFVYGLIYRATLDETTGELTQISYVALGIGVLVGLGPAFLAKRNWTAYIIGAVLALFAAILGELYGTALIVEDFYPGVDDNAFTILFKYFGDTWDSWQDSNEAINYIFLALSPVAAIGICQAVLRRTGGMRR